VSVWSEIFLGIIAAATLAMAIVLVGVLVAAGRAARRLGLILDQLETEVKPLLGHLNAIGRDASRAAALATAQVERVDRLFADVAFRVDESVQSVFAALERPARKGRSMLGALAAAVHAMRDVRGRRTRGEEDDALFI
jgi:uncharacterized protein YoxC